MKLYLIFIPIQMFTCNNKIANLSDETFFYRNFGNFIFTAKGVNKSLFCGYNRLICNINFRSVKPWNFITFDWKTSQRVLTIRVWFVKVRFCYNGEFSWHTEIACSALFCANYANPESLSSVCLAYRSLPAQSINISSIEKKVCASIIFLFWSKFQTLFMQNF